MSNTWFFSPSLLHHSSWDQKSCDLLQEEKHDKLTSNGCSQVRVFAYHLIMQLCEENVKLRYLATTWSYDHGENVSQVVASVVPSILSWLSNGEMDLVLFSVHLHVNLNGFMSLFLKVIVTLRLLWELDFDFTLMLSFQCYDHFVKQGQRTVDLQNVSWWCDIFLVKYSIGVSMETDTLSNKYCWEKWSGAIFKQYSSRLYILESWPDWSVIDGVGNDLLRVLFCQETPVQSFMTSVGHSGTVLPGNPSGCIYRTRHTPLFQWLKKSDSMVCHNQVQDIGDHVYHKWWPQECHLKYPQLTWKYSWSYCLFYKLICSSVTALSLGGRPIAVSEAVLENKYLNPAAIMLSPSVS